MPHPSPLPGDLTLAHDRISLLATGMVVAFIFELALALLIKRIWPEYIQGKREIIFHPILLALLLSVMTAIISRIRTIPLRVRLGIGIAYVLVMAVVISVAQLVDPWWTDGGRLEGMPWVCIWLLLVPLVVPIGWGRGAGRGILLSIIPLIVMFAGVHWFDLPHAPIVAYLDFFLPCLIASVVGGVVAKMMYGLTLKAREAQELGSYRLVEKIGSGGMGEVWRAEHRLLVRPAAIKLIRPENLSQALRDGTSSLIERFQREAQATASLHSPHTVRLYDFGVADDGTFFYVMELLSGLDLRDLVRQFGPLQSGRVVYLMLQACDSLADAHANGLLHRDIKPANIVVCRAGQQTDYVKLLDFGLVKSVVRREGGVTLTSDQTIIGTPAFMAPEAVEGGTVDHRLDIYSLGCVAYWLLTGCLVFEADTPMAMAVAHARDEVVPPSARAEMDIPAELDRILLDCLAKDPTDRPRDANELASRLADCPGLPPWDGKLAREWWATHLPQLGSPTQ